MALSGVVQRMCGKHALKAPLEGFVVGGKGCRGGLVVGE